VLAPCTLPCKFTLVSPAPAPWEGCRDAPAAGMLRWGSHRWISRCFPQIFLAVLVSLLEGGHTAQVRELLQLFCFVLLGG